MNARSRRPLSLANLRAFDAVARHLNFSEAADELFVTQSAISRQIKSLEDELGTALFLRGTRHVELTQGGQMLLRAVDPSLRRLDAAVHQIRQVGRRQRVNITTFASFGSLWITCPSTTCCTSAGATPARRIASAITVAPNWAGAISFSAPPKSPMAVRVAPTI